MGTTKRRWRLSLMDRMALIGGIINTLVIGVIIVYWFLGKH
ncbi:hypothetical protein [Thiolapillus sp.]